MIAVDDVTVAFETVTAIADIDLQINPASSSRSSAPPAVGRRRCFA